MKLSVIFEERPETWGYRGDPYFWDHLREQAENMEPVSPDELEAWIKNEYFSLSGKVMTDSGYPADAIILNPTDYAALVSASLSASHTLFGPDYTTFMGLPIV